MYATGELIKAADIFSRFQTEVINKVLSVPYLHLNNPGPIPTSYLDYPNIIKVDSGHNMGGYKNNTIYADNGNNIGSIYGGLTYLSRTLMKLGRYEYRTYREGNPEHGGYDRTETGWCMFSNNAVFQAFNITALSQVPITPARGDVKKDLSMKLSSFDSLIRSCYDVIANSDKVWLNIINGTCHSDHSNGTVTNPHTNTATGKGPVYCNTPWAYSEYPDGTKGPPPAGWHNNSGGLPEHSNSGKTTYSCHSNTFTLSLKSGNCNTTCHTICHTTCHRDVIGGGGILKPVEGGIIKPS